jgi:SAM-dependent methyltransferase
VRRWRGWSTRGSRSSKGAKALAEPRGRGRGGQILAGTLHVQSGALDLPCAHVDPIEAPEFVQIARERRRGGAVPGQQVEDVGVHLQVGQRRNRDAGEQSRGVSNQPRPAGGPLQERVDQGFDHVIRRPSVSAGMARDKAARPGILLACARMVCRMRIRREAHTCGAPDVDNRLVSQQFPRSSAYHPDWIVAGVSGGANPLWLTEWLAGALDLRPDMRVLDLGCGQALSSIFLRREFGVQVWATDLWFNASGNLRRIRDAGVEDGVFPIHADARSLPFAAEFFDAIVSIDSFPYYGTDDLFLSSVARFVKPGGAMGIAGAGLTREIDGPVPDHLRHWWTPDLWCLHSAAWWRRHWERTGIVDVTHADTLLNGWQVWLDWHKVVAPDNAAEIQAVDADRGSYLGYVRVVGRRRMVVALDEPIASVPTEYVRQPLMRGPE